MPLVGSPLTRGPESSRAKPSEARNISTKPAMLVHHATPAPYRLAVGSPRAYGVAVAVSKNPLVRGVFLALGVFSLGVAFIGVLLPLIPTTGPVLLAAFFFSKSSERFDRWLETNALFGGIVRDWRTGVGFTVRAKTIAVIAIAATFTISVFLVTESTLWRIALVLLGMSIALYVVTRPTKVVEPAS